MRRILKSFVPMALILCLIFSISLVASAEDANYSNGGYNEGSQFINSVNKVASIDNYAVVPIDNYAVNKHKQMQIYTDYGSWVNKDYVNYISVPISIVLVAVLIVGIIEFLLNKFKIPLRLNKYRTSKENLKRIKINHINECRENNKNYVGFKRMSFQVKTGGLNMVCNQ